MREEKEGKWSGKYYSLKNSKGERVRKKMGELGEARERRGAKRQEITTSRYEQTKSRQRHVGRGK